MLDPFRTSYEVMQVHLGDRTCATAEAQTDDHRVVVARDIGPTAIVIAPVLRSHPAVDDQHSSRRDVIRETLDRGPHLAWVRDVSDRSEQARDRVEPPA